jgi:(1->4)-alpha-D-glucan 1-alpha-D-glucosylmutase
VADLRATYRLQLTPELDFQAVRELIPYLRDLGISHLYLSPSFEARPGSTHGYDVIDPGRLSSALGGEQAFRELSVEAHAAGLGIVLDVVPNHMAADDANPYWADPELRDRFFDIDPVTGRHRRFFDIDELAGVRQEDEHVFEATHRLVLGLVRDGLVDGLRVDHSDGLADPATYFDRLRERGAERVWVEKILDTGERLRDWPVSGTVGYEFLNDVAALFVDPAGEQPLTRLWEEISGDPRTFGEVALEAKLEQLGTVFAPEVQRLARELGAGAEPPGGLDGLRSALASLPVYRTYVEAAAGTVADEDRVALAHALGMKPEIAAMLLLAAPAPAEFVTRFQQTTPAVTAKGVEDTAFYRYARLLALNDVGGDPSRFGLSVERFHAANAERARRFPQALLTTMTHDAKRSGDVRARIGALAGMAGEWAEHVARWLELGHALRVGDAPDDVEQYFIFQTLVGTWPIEVARVQSYMDKALREAKRHTNWIEPDTEWEWGVREYVRRLLADQTFMADFERFAETVARVGDRAALGQLALKLTSPGVPDIYQGDELPYRALVDPDNRRPVDWQWSQSMLARLMGGSPPDGETRKLWLVKLLLTLRIRRADAFTGGYEPLEAGEEAVAFVRGGSVLVVVGVRPSVQEGACLDAPEGRWRDVLRGGTRTFGGRVALSDVLSERGIAVYARM